jgi:hypothetical protein
MSWPPYAKGDEKGLARYVIPAAAARLKLSVNRDDLLAQGAREELLKAMYTSLLEREVRYARELYDPRLEQQLIRDPFAILDGSGEGTCLDLALLFAGLCLAHELLPLVVVLDGHALVAVSLTRGRRAASAMTRQDGDEEGPWVEGGLLVEGSTLRRLVERGDYIAIECTGFAASTAISDKLPEGKGRTLAGRMPFGRARAAGSEQLLGGRDFVFAIDIAVLQDLKFLVPFDVSDLSLGEVPIDLRVRLQGVLESHAPPLVAGALETEGALPSGHQDEGRRLALFGGRDNELRQLDEFLEQTSSACLLVEAPAGGGKTALLANWIRRLTARGERVAYHFINRHHQLAREEDVLRSLGQQLLFWQGRRERLPTAVPDLKALLLTLLSESNYAGRLVVVIDGMDEAEGWKPGPQFLPRRVASGVYLILSARVTSADWFEELRLSQDTARLALSPLEPKGIAALLKAAGGRTATFADNGQFVQQLSVTSGGDPFYLNILVDDIRAGLIATASNLAQQPKKLNEYFGRWWKELQGAVRERPAKDLLGYLLVSRGRLMRDELADISPDDDLDGFTTDGAVEQVHRFIIGDATSGYALCHPRFQGYLADNPLKESSQRPYRERLLAWCAAWRVPPPKRYAVARYVTHLVERVDAVANTERVVEAELLLDLVSNAEFQRRHQELNGDLPALYRDVEMVLETLARMPEATLAQLLRAALGVEEFRRNWLRPAAVFDLAASGKIPDALARLELFTAEEHWMQAARLLIAWIGYSNCEKCRERAVAIHERALAEPNKPPLPLLVERVGAALGRNAIPDLVLPYPPGRLPSPPSIEQAKYIVDRLGGSSDPEVRYSGLEVAARMVNHGDEAPKYLAEHDSPHLVALTQAQPAVGAPFLKQYISIHAGNPYADYRNHALWGVLASVLCFAKESEVVEYLRLLTEGALAPAPVRFREGLGVAVLACQLAAKKTAGAETLFEQRINEAVEVTEALRQIRGRADTWGNHCRRLAVLAECCAALGWADRAESLLERARQLPFGFSGYQTPASLTLAEAWLVSEAANRERIARVLDAAERSAHNIQELGFCARSTARVNALRRRWWTAPTFNVAAVVDRFVAQPEAPEFAALHVVGEAFQWRRHDSETVPIPMSVLDASTLRGLARDVYHLPLARFELLNPSIGADDTLHAGQEINVPDSKFSAILAARFAADVVIRTVLSKEERGTLLSRLVPAAAPNPTALDTVLYRLVLTVRPTDEKVLSSLVALAPTEWLVDAADVREVVDVD